MAIGIMGAMDEEIALYLEKMQNPAKKRIAGFEFYLGQINGKEIILVKSGAGKVNAGICAQALISHFSPSSIIFTGVAGGLNPSLEIHDILICKDSIQHDMDASAIGFEAGQIPFSQMREFSSCENLLDIAKQAAESAGLRALAGRALSGDQFISDKKKALLLREKFGGDCVDMESAAVAHACTLNSIPHIAIRSISDKADGTAPSDFSQFVKTASKNSFCMVEKMLEKLQDAPEENSLKKHIRTVPHWPKEGVMFHDITTLLKNPQGFSQALRLLERRYSKMQIDVIVGIESRGFIIGAALADRLNLGFVPIRKKNKLPAKTIQEEYCLEYGTDIIEIHEDSIKEGSRVLVIDDLIATGGTAIAACNLIKKLKAEVVECGFIIDLPALGGRKKLTDAGFASHTLVEFEGE